MSELTASASGLTDGQLQKLDRWLAEHGIGGTDSCAPSRLDGGTQNLMLRVDRGRRGLVVRAAAPGRTATGLAREASVLEGLHGSDVPHARFVALCADAAVIGRPFIVTEWVDGINLTASETSADTPLTVGDELVTSIVHSMLAIGSIDLDRAQFRGLRPARSNLREEAARWVERLRSYDQFDGTPSPITAATQPLLTKLAKFDVRPARGTLVHGDLHIGNLLLQPDLGRVAAVVDWELAGIGDPRLDLGLMLASWPDHHREFNLLDVGAYRLPPAAEVQRQYEQHLGHVVEDLDWFFGFASLRSAAIIEGAYMRSRVGLFDTATGERLHRNAEILIDAALQRL